MGREKNDENCCTTFSLFNFLCNVNRAAYKWCAQKLSLSQKVGHIRHPPALPSPVIHLPPQRPAQRSLSGFGPSRATPASGDSALSAPASATTVTSASTRTPRITGGWAPDFDRRDTSWWPGIDRTSACGAFPFSYLRSSAPHLRRAPCGSKPQGRARRHVGYAEGKSAMGRDRGRSSTGVSNLTPLSPVSGPAGHACEQASSPPPPSPRPSAAAAAACLQPHQRTTRRRRRRASWREYWPRRHNLLRRIRAAIP